jgi:hypothetical protein
MHNQQSDDATLQVAGTEDVSRLQFSAKQLAQMNQRVHLMTIDG